MTSTASTSPAYSTARARTLGTGCGKGVVRVPIGDGNPGVIFGGDSVVILRDGVPVGGVYALGGHGFQAYSLAANAENRTAVSAYGSTEEEAAATFRGRFEGFLLRPARPAR